MVSTLAIQQKSMRLAQLLPSLSLGKFVCVVSLALSVCIAVASEMTGYLLIVCLACGLLVAAWIDTLTRLIPNRLTYPLILLGVCGNLAISISISDEVSGVIGIEESLKGLALCFSVMLLLFLSNATGGGDVKLATAIGAFLGPQAGAMAIAWCHVLAGVFVLVWILSRLRLLHMLRSSWAYGKACIVSGRLQPTTLAFGSVAQKRIPMAAFFALGVLVTQLGFRLW